MHYGQLLSDFNKLAQVPCRLRLIVLVADDGYIQYIERSGGSILPLRTGDSASIEQSSLDRLADTPRQKANTYGQWRDLRPWAGRWALAVMPRKSGFQNYGNATTPNGVPSGWEVGLAETGTPGKTGANYVLNAYVYCAPTSYRD